MFIIIKKGGDCLLSFNLNHFYLKLMNIFFNTNYLFECVAKLRKIHKAQVRVKRTYWKIIKLEEKLKIKIQDHV